MFVYVCPASPVGVSFVYIVGQSAFFLDSILVRHVNRYRNSMGTMYFATSCRSAGEIDVTRIRKEDFFHAKNARNFVSDYMQNVDTHHESFN